MNELNYGSLEACKRLVDAGIVLETEAGWVLVAKNNLDPTKVWVVRGDWADIRYEFSGFYASYPAPSMAEVWRELPEEINPPSSQMFDDHILYLTKTGDKTQAGYDHCGEQYETTNPIDALIDLLIWVKEANHER